MIEEEEEWIGKFEDSMLEQNSQKNEMDIGAEK